MSFLSQIIAQTEPHPLLAQLYYLRSQLALSNPEMTSIAEEDARYLLEQFPGARELADVYRLLAYAALQKEPPQYRTAAEYLTRLKEEKQSTEGVFRINRLIGDCYFLNEDYANAVDFYRSADKQSSEAKTRADLFLRLVVSEMRAGDLKRAISFVDEADFSGSIRQADRWMAEWNISQALLERGELIRARERVGELLGSSGDDAVPTILDLRLRWLELYLRLVADDLSGLTDAVADLLNRVEAVPGVSADGSDMALLKTELMLLLANVMIAEERAEPAFAVLRQLREEYPESTAAQRTYLAEASYHASVADFRSAQAVLVELADSYPDGQLAAQALFEAAFYAERRGAEYYGDAILLLDRLVETYSQDPIAYHAGLKQGDLLRLMNDFASAQLLYENLINTYPEHSLRYVAELARADCLVALAGDDRVELADAAAVLERLQDLPNLPEALQVEVGYKWGMVLQKRGMSDEARDAFTLVAGNFLLDAERVVDLGSVGQYWLARSTLELGGILESEGEPDEARRLYRKMIAFNLPGRSIATARLERLPLLESR